MIAWRGRLAGIALCILIAAAATLAGRALPIVGAPVAAMLLGIVAGAALRDTAVQSDGVRWSGKIPLQAAIVLLGTGISLGEVLRVGAGTLPLIVGTMVLCLGAAATVGRLLQVTGGLRMLVGVGTAVCGASAIAAIAPVIQANETDVSLALGTVFFYNVLAVFVFPLVGHAFGFSQAVFGVWAGTAINDTSSVVAAAYAYGPAAGAEAVVVKLVRATTIVIFVVILAVHRRRTGGRWWRALPAFLPWFLAATVIDTAGVIPAGLHVWLSAAGLFCIAVALAGIGLQTDLARFVRAGWRPLALGLVLWIVVAGSSLVIQRLSGMM